MLEQQVTIVNKLGLHARAAAKLVKTTTSFAANISIEFQEQTADGKSIMGVMMLGAGIGSELILRVEGEDEQEALLAICALIVDFFGEGE